MNIDIIKGILLFGLLPLMTIIISVFTIKVMNCIKNKKSSKIKELYLTFAYFLSLLFTISILIISILVLLELKRSLPLLKTKAFIFLWILFPIVPGILTLNLGKKYYQLKNRKRGAK